MKRYSRLGQINLSTRITLGALIMVALGALLLIFVEADHRRTIFINEREADLGEALRLNETRLHRVIDNLRRDVRFLAATPPIAGIIRATRNQGYDPRDKNSLAEWEDRLQLIFQAFLRARPDYYQAGYIGVADQGRELVRASNRHRRSETILPTELQTEAGREYFQAAAQMRPPAIHLSAIEFQPANGQPVAPLVRTIQAALPILDDDGETFGLTVIGLELDALLQAAGVGLPAGVAAYIGDQRGRYLLHPAERTRSAAELADPGAMVRDFPVLAEFFDAKGVKDELPLQIAGYPGRRYYLTAARIHYNPDNPEQFLLLAYGFPAKLAQQAAAIPRAKIIIGFAALLLVCGVVFFVLRRMFAPLTELAAVATDISSGKQYFALPHGGGGEIGDLSQALAEMLTELSRREQEIIRINQGLEKQVSERTEALTRTNEQLAAEMREREQALQEARTLAQRNKAIIETAQTGFWLANREGILLEANQAYAAMSGYTVEELVGMHISQLEAQENPEEVQAHIANLIRDGYDRFETRHRRKDGREIDIEVSTTFMPETGQLFVFCLDISQRKLAEQEIRALAFYDPLTKLANRRLFLDHFRAALAASERHDDCGALLFIDMDRFKLINDTCGHECGDAMLIEVANRIKSCLRERDLASRFGGDEFVVLLEELGCDRDETARKVEMVAEKIRAALARPYLLKGEPQHSSPSIGVCLYHGHRDSVETILQRADQAMYEAKNAGRNTIRIFNRATTR